MTIVILRTGSPTETIRERRGEFSSLIEEQMRDAWPHAFHEIDVTVDEPPPVDLYAAVIVTGSPSSVTERQDWMLRAEEYLRRAVAIEKPVLGICFGHQLLAQALGGLVLANPRGREIGTVDLDLTLAATVDPLFSSLPRRARMNATHVDSAARLPPQAELLASTPKDPHAAFRVGHHAYGVQFHPEFDGAVMRGYIRARADLLRDEGFDVEALYEAAIDTPLGSVILTKFIEACVIPGSSRLPKPPNDLPRVRGGLGGAR